MLSSGYPTAGWRSVGHHCPLAVVMLPLALRCHYRRQLGVPDILVTGAADLLASAALLVITGAALAPL